MSRLRRTETGDLRPPHLGRYPDTTFQIWGPHLTCPGTSSSGTALFSTLLAGGVWRVLEVDELVALGVGEREHRRRPFEVQDRVVVKRHARRAYAVVGLLGVARP